MKRTARAISDDQKTIGITPKIRSSNIELLRILAMIGIVMSHLLFSSPHGGAMIAAHTFQTFYMALLQGAGQIGVFIFFIITGYFMVNKPFKIDGIKKVLIITWFYSTTFFIFALLVGAFDLNAFFNLDPSKSAFSIQNTIQNLMPILQNNYWFINAYIVILLLSPALNQLIHATKKETLQLILILSAIGFYLLNFFSRQYGWGLTFEIYSNLLLYSLVYAVGAYLQLYPPKIKTTTLLILLGGAVLLYTLWRYNLVLNIESIDIANKDTDFPPFAISIIIFVLFTRLKMGQIKWINLVAGSTLAVYIIHTNTNVWGFIWKTFDIYSVFGTAWLYLYPFVIATLVFAICIGIDLLRKLFVDKVWSKIDKVEEAKA